MQYRMKVSLNIIEHLGVNLYSNLPAVLSEIVANSWDADATEVKMNIYDTDKIEIIDNGFGMNKDDINEKFLNVGYKKRADNFTKTPSGRKVMGRKGIGKLSLFSIANKITVISKKKDDITNAFIMDIDDIKKAIDEEGVYEPTPLDNNSLPMQIECQGTVIILEKLKRERIKYNNIRMNLARRFSIIDNSNFKVVVNGKEIGIEERNYFKKLDYIWYFGESSKKFLNLCKEGTQSTLLQNNIDDSYSISGWIGNAEDSGLLQEEDGDENLNKISILVRGKLAQEDILAEFRIGGLYTKFLIGEICADFLDDDNLEDIATSNRQKLKEDDQRYILLKEFLRKQLGIISNQRQKFKEEMGVKEAQKYEPIKKWYDSLDRNLKKQADKLFGKINQIAKEEKDKITLMKQGVLAFENMKIRNALDSLNEISDDNLEKFLEIFDYYRDIEAGVYYTITSERLKIIQSLKEKMQNNEKERILQEHIFDNLWLLDPSWERGTENAQMEEVIQLLAQDDSDDIKKGRIDIHYRKTAGEHLIIELKRANVNITFSQITGQLGKYKMALKNKLKQINRENETIECIFICGKIPKEWEDLDTKKEDQDALKSKRIKLLTYDELIIQSYNAYKEYIDRDQESTRILKILKEIDQMEE
ncbi:ATP-binding protein [Campylobacter lari]|uniref:BbrUII/HgiDII family restriction enzyme n=1 Tax=Campylobacter lari TaxID=201 RepID=UPI00215371E0|nr:ATP-binding protein [Campylobacter lari]MCR6526898.1 ATP-binding protein [Campylobacter lari]